MLNPELVKRALELLGPNGERWIKTREAKDSQGNFAVATSDKAVCWCLMGSVYRAADELQIQDRGEQLFWLWYLWYGYVWQYPASITQWNDASERTWEEVKAFLTFMKDYRCSL